MSVERVVATERAMGITVGVETGVRLEAVSGAAEGLTSGVAVGVAVGCTIGVMMGCTIGREVLSLTCSPRVSSGARIISGFHKVGSAIN